ncbi:MAG: leucine-rich repeat protein [Oscillospiraceae bacterium]|nr:leucine-rich repeat protein [Oscillospiraceae bacterium]
MKAQNKKSRKILAGLLSSAIILGASGTSGIPLGLSAVAEPTEPGEPAVQAELPFIQEECSGDFRDIDSNNNLSWHYKDNTLTISGNGDMPDWGFVDDTTTSPERPWQNFKDQITKIVIEDGVTSIGSYAFCNLFCHDYFGYVLEVEIGRNVKEIHEGAFYNTGLTKVTIPENVEKIYDRAFYNNWMLSSVLLTNKTEIIGDSVFEKCPVNNNLTYLEGFSGKFSELTVTTDEGEILTPYPDNKLSWSFKDGVLTISGAGAMPNWNIIEPVNSNPYHWQHRPWEGFKNQIKEVVIENGVTSIGEYAFCTDYSTEPELKMTIPNTVTSIGRNAFYYNLRLKELTIPDSVTTIGREAFWHSQNLESIKLSENLTVLEDHVFNDCRSLTSIEIPESVTTIRNDTFIGCTSLTEVVIPKNVTLLGNTTFKNCTALQTVTFEGTDVIPNLGNNVFENSPCAADGAKGLIIHSCAVLDDYRVHTGWDDATSYKDNIDKTHDVTYTAEGAVITETCHANGCHHVATAELFVEGPYPYTGSEIKPVTNTYSNNWAGTGDKKPADTDIQYKKNIKVGTAEASLTITNDDGTPATSEITFIIASDTTYTITATPFVGEYDGQGHSITINLPDDIPAGTKITYSETENGTYTEENPPYTNVGDYTVYYKVETPDGQVIPGSSTVKITPKPITDPMVTITPDPDGGKPTVTVTDGDTTLTPGKDYTLVISGPNKNPTTGENKYEVKVTGKGNYKDPVTKPVYVIDSDGWSGMYDGKEHSITVKGYPTGSKIKYGTTPGTYDLDDNPKYTDKGDYTVYYQVELPNGQVETGSNTVKITPKPITDNMVKVTPDPDDPNNPPKVEVTDGDTPLVPDKDYTVVINGPTPDPITGEPTYEITVTGTDNYTDEVEKTIPEETGGIYDVSSEGWSGTYDGKPHSITVKDIPDGATVTYLQENGTYGPTKPTHTDVGTYTDYYRVELNGKKITGSDTVVITPKPITDPTVTVNVVADPDNPDTPKVTVKDGGTTLTPNKDYTVTVDPDTGKVTVTGTGNYNKDREESIPKNPGDGTTPGGTTPGGTRPGGTTPGGTTPGGDDTSDPSSDNSDPNSGDTSDPSSDNSDPNSGDTSDNSGNTSDNNDSTTPNTPSDSDNQNPGTGNPIATWTWILLTAATATGVTVVKSKSKRKKN